MDFEGYSFGFEEPVPEQEKQIEPAAEQSLTLDTEDNTKVSKGRQHRKSELYELSLKYEYRRAFSEVKLLDLMGHFEFKKGHAYNFITGGDIDSLSFLKAILRHQPLDHCIASTWCMGAEDILQIRDWIRSGAIKHIDIYVGEIFSSSYKVEYRMLQKVYEEFPDLGRYAMFRNHSKVFAGIGPDFAFGIQSSANINTNPRTENTCIIIDDGIYRFYKEYYDGIISIDREQRD